MYFRAPKTATLANRKAAETSCVKVVRKTFKYWKIYKAFLIILCDGKVSVMF